MSISSLYMFSVFTLSPFSLHALFIILYALKEASAFSLWTQNTKVKIFSELFHFSYLTISLLCGQVINIWSLHFIYWRGEMVLCEIVSQSLIFTESMPLVCPECSTKKKIRDWEIAIIFKWYIYEFLLSPGNNILGDDCWIFIASVSF